MVRMKVSKEYGLDISNGVTQSDEVAQAIGPCINNKKLFARNHADTRSRAIGGG